MSKFKKSVRYVGVLSESPHDGTAGSLHCSVSVVRGTLPTSSPIVRLVQQVWKLVNALKRVRRCGSLPRGTAASAHTTEYPPKSADEQGDSID